LQAPPSTKKGIKKQGVIGKGGVIQAIGKDSKNRRRICYERNPVGKRRGEDEPRFCREAGSRSESHTFRSLENAFNSGWPGGGGVSRDEGGERSRRGRGTVSDTNRQTN